MHEDWQESEGTRGHKYWGMGSEARKMVADHMKAKGGALRDRKTCLNLRLDNGRRHGVYVSMSTLSTPNCVVYLCMFGFVCVGSNQRFRAGKPYRFSPKDLRISLLTMFLTSMYHLLLLWTYSDLHCINVLYVLCSSVTNWHVRCEYHVLTRHELSTKPVLIEKDAGSKTRNTAACKQFERA